MEVDYKGNPVPGDEGDSELNSGLDAANSSELVSDGEGENEPPCKRPCLHQVGRVKITVSVLQFELGSWGLGRRGGVLTEWKGYLKNLALRSLMYSYMSVSMS